jgi:hypothetical protein
MSRERQNPAENGRYMPDEESTGQTPMPLTLNCFFTPQLP